MIDCIFFYFLFPSGKKFYDPCLENLVAQVLKKCSDDGLKAKVADFGDKVEDSTFLNALQNQVNKWIREIQKVTKLD